MTQRRRLRNAPSIRVWTVKRWPSPTAVCVVDDQGTVLMQCSVATEPEAIAEALAPFAATLRRAGHEAGAVAPAASGAVSARRAGRMPGDPPSARRDVGPAQQDRR